MRSFMRLSRRRNVDLPQPDGPISAVTERSGISSETPSRACLVPYQKFTLTAANFGCVPLSTTGWRPLRLRWLMMAEYEMVDIRLSECPSPPGQLLLTFRGRVVVYGGIVGVL